jgi:hypothetical protein
MGSPTRRERRDEEAHRPRIIPRRRDLHDLQEVIEKALARRPQPYYPGDAVPEAPAATGIIASRNNMGNVEGVRPPADIP